MRQFSGESRPSPSGVAIDAGAECLLMAYPNEISAGPAITFKKATDLPCRSLFIQSNEQPLRETKVASPNIFDRLARALAGSTAPALRLGLEQFNAQSVFDLL